MTPSWPRLKRSSIVRTTAFKYRSSQWITTNTSEFREIKNCSRALEVTAVSNNPFNDEIHGFKIYYVDRIRRHLHRNERGVFFLHYMCINNDNFSSSTFVHCQYEAPTTSTERKTMYNKKGKNEVRPRKHDIMYWLLQSHCLQSFEIVTLNPKFPSVWC